MHDSFGFRKTPFTREVGVDEMLAIPHLDETRQALVARIERRSSVAVIAPAGTGKTCLLRAVRHQLPEARYRVHYVKVTELSKRDLCREIATAVGVPPAGTYPMLVRRLQEDFEQTSSADGAFRQLLIFAEKRLHRTPAAMHLDDLDAPLVLDFLDHVEKERGNGPRTRNLRVGAQAAS